MSKKPISNVEEITLSLMTPCHITQTDGLLHLHTTEFDSNRKTGSVNIHFDPNQLVAHIEPIDITDKRVQASWGKQLYRILLCTENPPVTDTWSIQITPS